MRNPHVESCEVLISDDHRTVVYCLRLRAGHAIQKQFEEYDRFYTKMLPHLPATQTAPPKKKFFQFESKLHEKRRVWIMALSQTLLGIYNRSPNQDIREFYCLPRTEEVDYPYVDLGPKEIRSAKPDDFDFLSTIGKGSFGRVFQVRHKETDRIYAMKVLSKDYVRKKNEVKHVMAELNVLKANINHPFLVSLHFSFQTKEKLYFVLDHLNGGELFTHLQIEKTFCEARARFYAAGIASALGYLHENDIIYRDLKPENLLLDRTGYIVLTDFGLCKENMPANATTNTFCGTPEYLAPEIVLKKSYDRTVDWWCLGAVLYEMLYGLPPFYSKDHKEMYDKIVNQPLKLKHHISNASSDIIQQMLMKDRTKRLGSKFGYKEIKEHAFFSTVDFDKLLLREIKAPFIPKIKNDQDLSHISKEFVMDKFNPASLVPTNPSLANRDEFMGFTYVQPSHLPAC
ncbi:unnamed protein product [Auanema sp. JU1783]|nr:unnamed protein product [Auanema sp. JU1783]